MAAEEEMPDQGAGEAELLAQFIFQVATVTEVEFGSLQKMMKVGGATSAWVAW